MSNRITVKEVKTKKEQRLFIQFPLKMYKDNPNFVPPLYGDEKAIFKKDYPYYETCEAVYYLAYCDNQVVGRISGILQKASNELRNEKRVRFTRFDSIDDQDVANALFDAVEKWALDKGMDTICGPLGFSDLEREGLLIEGFDQLATFEEQYNADYYQELIENCGYGKEVDWLEHKILVPKQKDEKMIKLANRMMEKYKLHVGKYKNTKELLKHAGEKVFALIDESYRNLYGTVPFTEGVRKMVMKSFQLIVKPQYCHVVFDENDNLVCFGLVLPSIAKAVQKSQGRLTLPALFKLLKAINKPEILDLALIGVTDEYKSSGVIIITFAQMIEYLHNKNISHMETNLNLETNTSIISLWKRFETEQHKRRRSFVKKIK